MKKYIEQTGYGVSGRPYYFIKINNIIVYSEDVDGDEFWNENPKLEWRTTWSLEWQEFIKNEKIYNSIDELLAWGRDYEIEKEIVFKFCSEEEQDAYIERKKREKEEEDRKNKFELVEKPRGYTIRAYSYDYERENPEMTQKNYKYRCEKAWIEMWDIEKFNEIYFPIFKYWKVGVEKR